MGIADYSTTPGDNSSISGINIAEGCAPGNINNAIRQQLADIATDLVMANIATATPVAGDFFSFQDISASNAHRKVTLQNLLSAVAGSGLTATSGTLVVSSTIPSTTQTDYIAGVVETPENGDYRLVVKIPIGVTITETVTRSASGTCTATFKINTTALGGTANSVSSTEQARAHSTSNVVSADDDVVLTISSNSSCDRMSFTIKYTRTLV